MKRFKKADVVVRCYDWHNRPVINVKCHRFPDADAIAAALKAQSAQRCQSLA